jgi:ribonuclease R
MRNFQQEKIVEFLRSEGYKPLTTQELAAKYNVERKDFHGFKEMLEQLQLEGKIVQGKGGRWRDVNSTDLLVGILDRKPKGFGFVMPVDEDVDEDVYVPGRHLGTAVDGDTVVVKYWRKKRQRKAEHGPAGRIVKVLKRAHKRMVGTFMPGAARLNGKKAGLARPDDPSIVCDVIIPRGSEGGAEENDKVLIHVLKWPDPEKGYENALGEVQEVLGREGDPAVDEVALICKYGLPESFPEAVIKEARSIPFEPDGGDLKGRKDLSECTTVAIDPETARDRDDALSVRHNSSAGEWVALVHIADVSHHVKPGSALDKEAMERGCSVYLVHDFIPMLPKEQTQKCLSLSSGSRKLAKTVELRFDEKGKLKDYSIYRSVVKLDAEMSYKEVQEILDAEGKSLPESPTTNKWGSDVKDMVLQLDQLAQILRGKRRKEGSVDLDVPEYDVKVDEDGRVSAVFQTERDRSHDLVEELMLSANVAVAKFLHSKGLPGIFRVHEKPETEDLESFGEFVKSVMGEVIDPFDRSQLQDLLAEVADTNLSEAVNMELLRCMMRAHYAAEPSPHYALHFDHYCHYTSPIRRYPDLVVHQILDEHMDGRLSALKRINWWKERIPGIAKQASRREERAVEAEREIVKIKIMRFLKDKVSDPNQVFNAVVTGVQEFGVFAQLQDFSIEGLIKVHELKDDFYEHKPEKRALVGRKKGKEFRLGQKLQVRIVRVDTDKREIDLTPA